MRISTLCDSTVSLIVTAPNGSCYYCSILKWSERQDSNLRRLAPKASALARLSYIPKVAEFGYSEEVFGAGTHVTAVRLTATLYPL